MLLLGTINALLVINLFLILIEPSFATNYCSKDLCKGKRHCRCGKDGSFGPDCPKNAEEVQMTEELKRLIVDIHNEVRESISEGNYKGLKPANRMIKMEWENELAENARYTAKTCLYVHDECRNTPTYSDVGQNIALFSKKSTKKMDINKTVKKIIDSWLSQADNVANEIQRYGSFSGNESDYFAQMIRASCGHIGCALVYYVSDDDARQNLFFVCNYSSANVPNEPIYDVGPACSACVTGCSKTSPGLCKTEEENYLIKLKLLNLTQLKIEDPLKLGRLLNIDLLNRH
ncbi:hypothetical protein HA402_015408 [Bradysia odoriphaga]|nr:hypothetical protein HA402_015408 [Bradysia odoriphaga]